MPWATISQKLNIPLDKIQERYDAAKESEAAGLKAGTVNLVDVFTNTCLQYNLLGEGLKHLGSSLSSPATSKDIEMVLHDVPVEKIVEVLLEKFIILKPIGPLSLEEMLKAVSGN